MTPASWPGWRRYLAGTNAIRRTGGGLRLALADVWAGVRWAARHAWRSERACGWTGLGIAVAAVALTTADELLDWGGTTVEVWPLAPLAVMAVAMYFIGRAHGLRAAGRPPARGTDPPRPGRVASASCRPWAPHRDAPAATRARGRRHTRRRANTGRSE